MADTATPDTTDVYSAVVRVVGAVLKIPVSDIAMDSKYIEDLSADSVKAAQIIFALEEEFGLDIDEGEIANLRSVANTVDYIHTRLNS